MVRCLAYTSRNRKCKNHCKEDYCRMHKPKVLLKAVQTFRLVKESEYDKDYESLFPMLYVYFIEDEDTAIIETGYKGVHKSYRWNTINNCITRVYKDVLPEYYCKTGEEGVLTTSQGDVYISLVQGIILAGPEPGKLKSIFDALDSEEYHRCNCTKIGNNCHASYPSE